uniref:Uncharacterized protein n=1 Tax=Pristhesancus plagipennis TaxID=1955184 RepID=A0A2K8JP37_PRIPG|nr:secreted hypothetical protein [Pristhesancus plagipennis]
MLIKLLLFTIVALLIVNSEALKRLSKHKSKDFVRHLGQQSALRVVAAKQLALMSHGEMLSKHHHQEAEKQNRIQNDEYNADDLEAHSSHYVADYPDYYD